MQRFAVLPYTDVAFADLQEIRERYVVFEAIEQHVFAAVFDFSAIDAAGTLIDGTVGADDRIFRLQERELIFVEVNARGDFFGHFARREGRLYGVVRIGLHHVVPPL